MVTIVIFVTIVTSSYLLKLSHLSHFHQHWSQFSCVTRGISHILGVVTLITFSPKLVTFVEMVKIVTLILFVTIIVTSNMSRNCHTCHNGHTYHICFNCNICHSGNIYKNDYVCHKGHIFKEELNYEFLGKKIHWEEQILKRGLKGGWWWLPIKGFAVLPTPA